MKEKIYTIPVNDAFTSTCECPVCVMYKTLEDNSVEYTMGPSYMEDDVRSETDRLGFCEKHIKQVYHMDNRLGMAWVMKTHFDKIIDDVEAYDEVCITSYSINAKERIKKEYTWKLIVDRYEKLFISK